MGSGEEGQQRNLHCPVTQCNGLPRDQRLMAPVALASSPDGSIFVGDFNLIRRISPDGGQVVTVVELPPSQIAYSYHLAVGPATGHLYISDPERHQVIATLNNAELAQLFTLNIGIL